MHSKEPWEINDYGDVDVLVPFIVASGGFADKDDAERAVACVNFCRGMDAAMLEEFQANDIGAESAIELLRRAKCGGEQYSCTERLLDIFEKYRRNAP